MSVSFAPSKLRIPPGFEAILEGFCRQVLKEQPEQIVPFAAEYFAAKLEARNGSNQTQQTPLGEGSKPKVVETPAVSNGQVLLVEETSPQSVESLGQEMAKSADDVEMSDDANKDQGVLEDVAVKEYDGSMDEEAPAAATEGEGASDINEASTEVPQPTDVDRTDGTDAEEAKPDANVEASGEDPPSVDVKGEQGGTVPDKPSAVPGDPEPTVADGGLDEGTTNPAEVNASADEPVTAESDNVKEEKDDAVRVGEEAGDGDIVEGNGDNVEESREGEGDEVQEPAKDNASVEETEHDSAGDQGEGEGDDKMVEGEEPVKETDDGGNDHGKVEEKGLGEEEKSSSSVQPETEES